MEQNIEVKSSNLKSFAFEALKTFSVCAIIEGVKYIFKRLDKKTSHKERMKEAQFKHDLQKDMLKYRANMNNKSKADSAEQVNEEHEWEDLSEVVNDPDACQKIEYFPGTPVHKGDLCCIYSPTGQGKSTLVMQMLIAMSSGKNAGIVKDNQPDYKSHMVYLYDSELTREDFQVRYGKSGLDLSNIRMMQSSNFYEIERLIENIKNTIAKEIHDCVIAIDNMTDMFPRLSEEQVRLFKSSLAEIQKNALDRGVTVSFIVVLHSVKNSKGNGIQEMAGSVNWNRLFKTVLSISPSDFGDDYKILKVEKDRSASKRNNIILKRVENPYLHFEYYSEEGETVAFSQEVKSEEQEPFGNVPFKVVEEMYHMYQMKNKKSGKSKKTKDDISYEKILDRFRGQYGLNHRQQVQRKILEYENRVIKKNTKQQINVSCC